MRTFGSKIHFLSKLFPKTLFWLDLLYYNNYFKLKKYFLNLFKNGGKPKCCGLEKRFVVKFF